MQNKVIEFNGDDWMKCNNENKSNKWKKLNKRNALKLRTQIWK